MSIAEGRMSEAEKAERPTLGTIILLGALTAFAPVSVDMYLPGLPAIAHEFAVSPAAAQLTVAVFLFGHSIGQIVYGPLSDRIGRRGPLLAGVSCYCLATLGCAFAPALGALTVFRFLQAIGGCAGQVIARAIVRDRFHAGQAARIYSLLTLVMGVAPILAPSLGSLLVGAIGWRGIFAVQAVFAISCGVAAYFRLHESRHHEERLRARAESLHSSFAAVLSNRRFLGYVLGGSLSSMAMFAYIGSSPDILMNGYGFSPQAFGIAVGVNAFGFIAAAQINRALLNRYSSDQIFRVANLCTALFAVWLVCDTHFSLFGMTGVLLPLFFIMSALGITQPNALAGGMSTDPHRTGTISAIFGTVQVSFGAIGATLSAAAHDGTARPMAAVIMVGFVGALVAFRTLVPKRESASASGAAAGGDG
jgi:DHA1 family bicyclomycin/chloramphenicol resistance-like MFS transporter